MQQDKLSELEMLYRKLANEASQILTSNELTSDELDKLSNEDFKRISILNKQMFEINMQIIEEVKNKKA